jgi:hypothetical protein
MEGTTIKKIAAALASKALSPLPPWIIGGGTSASPVWLVVEASSDKVVDEVLGPIYSSGSETVTPLTVMSPVVTASMPETVRRLLTMDVPSLVPRVEDELVRTPLSALATAVASLIVTIVSTTTDPAESVTATSSELTVPPSVEENSEATAACTADLKFANNAEFATSAW